MRYKIEQALKDLGMKATEKQRDMLKDNILFDISIAKTRAESLTRRDYVNLVKTYMPLDVTASAVAFCSDLVKAMVGGTSMYGMVRRYDRSRSLSQSQSLVAKAAEDIDKEADKFKALCPEILTGSLDKGRGVPKWALEAASLSQPGGEHHKLGRLDKVSHRQVSFERVCKDECEALVQGIQEKAVALYQDFYSQESQKPKTVEQSCADHIIKHVESEILGCCSRSCALRHSSIAPLKS